MPFSTAPMYSFGTEPPDDLVDEFEGLPLFRRFNGDPDVAELPAAAGLTDVPAFLARLRE